MKKKLTGLAACMSLLLLVSSSTFGSFDVTPAGGEASLVTFGNQTSQAQIDDILDTIPGLILPEKYKADVGAPVVESGALAGAYETQFNNDASGATVTFSGGTSAIDPTHLLVKDGNATPAWYLFNISDWNGVEQMILSGFWPNTGAISHISIYGTTVPVPEPTSIGLFALGMSCAIGGSFARRRRLN